MKPRRPAVKDSTRPKQASQHRRELAAARAARKAATKQAKLAAEKKAPREDFSQAAARIVREATDKA